MKKNHFYFKINNRFFEKGFYSMIKSIGTEDNCEHFFPNCVALKLKF